MHDLDTPLPTRRSLREQERAHAPRRRRVRGHVAPSVPLAPAATHHPSAWAVAAQSAPVPALRPARPVTVETMPTPKPRRTKARSVLAAAFVVGLAATSAVPMLAFGQTAGAAAITAASVRGEGAVQSLQLSTSTKLPAATRDTYTSILARSDAAIHAGNSAGDGDGKIQWPFPGGSPISSGFGPRIAPTAGASSFHLGVDFTPGAGTPIQNIAAGTVTSVVTNPSDSLGVHVIVDHGMIGGQHVESVYAEMAPGSTRVAVGQKLKPGDIIGLVGISGISTGAHLHYEVHLDGTPVDPVAWLTAHAGAEATQ
ncbi:M23 family metallopeptidase [Gryllotalpicola ginsengisoli]|uniref:M23 family metallopeptidase n=1 Tax=Gryllotalpicola ginsengisoli TaxID=444608 RepID=UPI0004228E93|nr:M23 family metallopeptidase [Gryllotalpicola ginsengisoli]